MTEVSVSAHYIRPRKWHEDASLNYERTDRHYIALEGASVLEKVIRIDSTITSVIDITEVNRDSTSSLVVIEGELVKILWKILTEKVKPDPDEVISIRPGEAKRIDDKILIEKTPDGRIILYEIEGKDEESENN